MKKLNIPIQTALTNADRIRSMTDIELAELLSTMVSSCDYCVHDGECTTYSDRKRCREGVLEYLKEGAKEQRVSALQSEYYAPDLRRSVIVAVHEYELMYGKKPAVIFAGSKAFQELTRELCPLPTTDYILFAKIPLKLSPVEEYAVYLAGDPVKIRPTKQYG